MTRARRVCRPSIGAVLLSSPRWRIVVKTIRRSPDMPMVAGSLIHAFAFRSRCGVSTVFHLELVSFRTPSRESPTSYVCLPGSTAVASRGRWDPTSGNFAIIGYHSSRPCLFRHQRIPDDQGQQRKSLHSPKVTTLGPAIGRHWTLAST